MDIPGVDKKIAFLSAIKDDRIPLTDVHSWVKENCQIAPRTFQLYVQEGLLPKPNFEWKNGFYTKKTFNDILDRIQVIKGIKLSEYIIMKTLKDIFENYKGKSEEVTQKLLSAIEEFPVYKLKGGSPRYSHNNDKTLKRICDELREGVDLKTISFFDIQGEVEGGAF